MKDKKFPISWLFYGAAFSIICFILVFNLPQLNYLGLTFEYRISTTLFLSGSIQLLLGLVFSKPSQKSYHVPSGSKEYRDPFVGLDREELADHGYGTQVIKKNLRREWEGLAFSCPGLVMIILSGIVVYLL